MSKLGCAFNYVGSKIRFKYQIEKILPKEENIKLLEPFCGGFSLVHLYPESWEITANDKQSQLIDLHQWLKYELKDKTPTEVVNKFRDYCHTVVDKENKTNRKAYEFLRDTYNCTKAPIDLYACICSSFSNQIRFNKDGEFNLPKGDRYFNSNMENKLLQYLTKLEKTNVTFENKDFREFDFSTYDLLMVDSPYLKTTASYCEGGGWTLTDQVNLLSKLDKASNSGVKFIMFEELWSKGTPNTTLIEWAQKYNIQQLGDNSSGSNYQRKEAKTQEVMIFNF